MIRTVLARLLPVLACVVLASCAAWGGDELVVRLQNGADNPAVLRIVPGVAQEIGFAPFDRDAGSGPGEVVEPGGDEYINLRAPFGEWTLTLNGRPVLTSPDKWVNDDGRTWVLIQLKPDELSVSMAGPPVDRSE